MLGKTSFRVRACIFSARKGVATRTVLSLAYLFYLYILNKMYNLDC